MVERDSGEMLGLVEAERAFTTVHPGAIYLHLGRSYEVEQLDIEGRRAVVARSTATGTRSPRRRPRSSSRRCASSARAAGVELHFGEVSVTEQVIAYQRKASTDHEVIDLVALDLPEQHFPTQALWYVLPERLSGARCRPTSCSARCTRPSTARSPCCR